MAKKLTFYRRGNVWWCRFTHRTKQVRQSCETEDEAEAFVVGERLRAEVVGSDNLADTVKRQIVRQYSRQLVTTPTKLDDALAQFEKKPKKTGRGRQRARQIQECWSDFIAFLKARHPDIRHVHQLSRAVAEEYITHIRGHGRFVRTVSYRWRGRPMSRSVRQTRLSHRTLNGYHRACSFVLQTLAEDAGLDGDPFARIPMLPDDSEARVVYTYEQLAVIQEHRQDDPEVWHIIIVGVFTALREGNICTLQVDDLDQPLEWLTVRRRKTGKSVRIPIMPPLKAHFLGLPREGDYVSQKLADLYLRSPDEVSHRIKRFLEGKCGFKTTRLPERRDRRISVLNAHSLRHTLAYLAGMHGIPIAVVQSILGHMSPRLTQLYMAHTTDADKQRAMRRLRAFWGGG